LEESEKHCTDQLKEQEKYKQAEEMLKITRNILMSAMEDGTLDLRERNVFAYLYMSIDLPVAQGKYDEAESKTEEAIEIMTKAHNANHSMVDYFRLGLPKIYIQQGKYEKAELFYKNFLEIQFITIYVTFVFTLVTMSVITTEYVA